MKRKQTILVVDDEPMIRRIFERLLSEEGYTVLTASNGKEGLEIVRKKSLELVILDLKLPDMSGIDILRRIRRLRKNVEVIVITGHGTMKTARAAMGLGAYDYITKPFDDNHVRALVKNALSPAPGDHLQHTTGDKDIMKETSNP